MTPADRALADKAKASGTAFQSRDDATKQFQQKYSQTYTSRYSSEPTLRPQHVPSTYIVHNHTYNVVYDRGYGGYGYYDSGRWCYYDAFTDAVMLSLLMERNSYYYPGYNYRQPQVVVVQQPQQPQIIYQQQPQVVDQNGQQVQQQPPIIVQQPPVIVQQSSGSGWGLFWGIAIGVVVLIVIGIVVARE